MKLSEVLSGKQVIVCGGSGGVGKTTLAAALGLHLASQGKRAVVITIDPARRLADALGISMDRGRVIPVPGTANGTGSLHAMMLTPELAVESFMHKLNADPSHPMVSERFFQQGMAMLAASPEYLAVQELYDLSHGGQWDAIVLDTPPTRQSIDFLTAPNRLAKLLKEKSVIVDLARPYLRINKMGFGLIKAGAKAILAIIDKIFGIETFIEFFTFFEACVTLLDLDQLEDRINKVNTLLQAPTTTFLVVASGNPVSIEEALYFHNKIASYQISFGGFVINRVQPLVACDDALLQRLVGMQADLATQSGPAFADYPALPAALPKLVDNLGDSVTLRRLEQTEIARLAAVLSPRECLVQVPRLERDVHDLAGIAQVATSLKD